jgi:hypothetical protein
MSETAYLNGWIVYACGVAVLILVGWRITRGLNIVLRVPLLMLLAAFLLTPFNIESGSTYMGPGWLIMLYEGVFLPEIGFSRVGPSMGIVALFSVVVFPVFYGIYRLFKKPQATQENSEAPAEA